MGFLMWKTSRPSGCTAFKWWPLWIQTCMNKFFHKSKHIFFHKMFGSTWLLGMSDWCSELFPATWQGAYLLATLMHNWHRPLYIRRGGKRTIKVPHHFLWSTRFHFSLIKKNHWSLHPGSRTGLLRRRHRHELCWGTFIPWPEKRHLPGTGWGPSWISKRG